MRPVHCVIPVIVAVCIGGSLSPAHALPAIDPAEPVISGEDMLNRFLGFARMRKGSDEEPLSGRDTASQGRKPEPPIEPTRLARTVTSREPVDYQNKVKDPKASTLAARHNVPDEVVADVQQGETLKNREAVDGNAVEMIPATNTPSTAAPGNEEKKTDTGSDEDDSTQTLVIVLISVGVALLFAAAVVLIVWSRSRRRKARMGQALHQQVYAQRRKAIRNKSCAKEQTIEATKLDQATNLQKTPSKLQKKKEAEETTVVDDASTQRLRNYVRVAQVLCAVYGAAPLLPHSHWLSYPGFAAAHWGQHAKGMQGYDGEDVVICPRSSICSYGSGEVALLAVARVSAYWFYPSLIFVVLTKCNALMTLLSNTSFSLMFPLSDLHEIHVELGNGIGIGTCVHVLFHLIRWGLRSELGMLATHVVGRSGTVAMLATVPLIALMTFQKCRRSVSWEVRKTIHVTCYLIFITSLMWHTTRLKWIMLVVLGIYAIDQYIKNFGMTHRVVNSHFHRLGSGVQLKFENPPNWDVRQLGYVNVCVPWVSKSEWHPFSCYPQGDNSTAVFMMAAGDWTTAVHKSIERDSHRPCFIQGIFASPYCFAVDYDHLILVATGIGITPALATLNSYKSERQVNLIWSCRDASLVDFFLNNTVFDDDGLTIIYYTGKTPLQVPENKPDNLFIIRKRPDLTAVIPRVIDTVEAQLSVSDLSNVEDVGEAELALVTPVEKLIQEASETSVERFDLCVLSCLINNMSLDELFEEFDPDHSGDMDRNELDIAMRRLGAKLSPEGVDAVLDSIGGSVDNLRVRVDEAAFKTYITHIGQATIDGAQYTELKPFVKQIELGLKRSTPKTGEVESLVACDSVVHTDSEVRKTVSSKISDKLLDNFDKASEKKMNLKLEPEAQSRWCMLYCGGSKPVIDQLRKVAKDLGILLKEESFDW